MENLNKEDRVDRIVSMVITLQVTLLGAKNVLVQGFPFFFDINTKLNIGILSIVSVLYLYSMFILRRRSINSNAVVYYIFVFFSIIFTFLLFPQNIPYVLAISLRWIVVLFLTGFLMAKLKSMVWLQKYMLQSSYILTVSCIMFAVIVTMVGQIASDETSPYSLTMSYVGMWAIMWQLHALFKSSNKIALVFALITLVIVVLYGSRNPLIAIGLYVVLMVINMTKSQKSSAIKFVSYASLLILGVLALYWKQIFKSLFSLFEGFGLSSRTVNMFLEAAEGDVDFSSGRDDIHATLWNLIFDHPVLGLGVCGDSANMNETAHSLYLSIFATFGLFIGFVFLLFIIRQCIVAYKKANGLNRDVLILFFCMVFPRGFTGGDFWESDVFWYMMGLVFMVLNNTNKKYATNCNMV